MATVVDTIKPYDRGAAVVVRYEPSEGVDSPLDVGARVESVVNWGRRERIEAHHSATHLLHAALRAVLGAHVTQAGSLVAEDRFQFDFTHHHPLTKQQLAEVATWVGEAINTDATLRSEEMPKERALSLGAMAMFGEKYGNVVRTVNVSFLCCCP